MDAIPIIFVGNGVLWLILSDSGLKETNIVVILPVGDGALAISPGLTKNPFFL